MDKSNLSFNNKLNKFIKDIPSYRYIFEITKECGYSELIIIFKDNTLLDLYKDISNQLVCNNIKRLYFKNELTSEEIDIPPTEKKALREFIVENPNLCPIYKMPTPTVYRIYIDFNII